MSLQDKIVFENAIKTFKGEVNTNKWISPKDVKESIQTVQKRLRKLITRKSFKYMDDEYKLGKMNLIFLSEFGSKLTWGD